MIGKTNCGTGGGSTEIKQVLRITFTPGSEVTVWETKNGETKIIFNRDYSAMPEESMISLPVDSESVYRVKQTKDGMTAEISDIVIDPDQFVENRVLTYYTAKIVVPCVEKGDKLVVKYGTKTVPNKDIAYSTTDNTYNITIHNPDTYTIHAEIANNSTLVTDVNGVTNEVSVEFLPGSADEGGDDGKTKTTDPITFATISVKAEGQNITVQHTDGTTIKKNILLEKTKFYLPKLGTWTIGGIDADGEAFKPKEKLIDEYQDYDISLGGGFEEWLEAAGVNPDSYSDLDEVLADEKLIRQLMTVHNSVDYLVGWLTDDEDAANTILDNDLCAKWINLRDYALDMLYADSNVKAIMDSVDKYGYGEWINPGLVPKLSSLTGGGVTISSNNVYNTTNTPAYGPFTREYEDDGLNYYQNSNYWTSTNTASPAYIQVEFDSPKVVNYVEFKTINHIKNFIIKASNDGSSFVDLYTGVGENNTVMTKQSVSIDNNTAYKYYQFYVIDSHYENWKQLSMLQFYGANWEPKGLVPIMTSDTAPYGEVKASSINSSYYAWHAFDGKNTLNAGEWISNSINGAWLQYESVSPLNITRIKLTNRNYDDLGARASIKEFRIEGSNDGTNWEPITDTLINPDGQAKTTYFEFKNNKYYIYNRIYVLSSNQSIYNYVSIGELQFYGRELKVSVPKMTSNTEPWGEANGKSCYSGYEYYKAFNEDSNGWCPLGQSNDCFIQFKFSSQVKVTTVATKGMAGWGENTVNLQGSLTGSDNDWTNIDNITTASGGNTKIDNVNNNDSYLYYRLFGTINGAGNGMKLQFYGLDYSEREFGEDSNVKYIYDHGLEFEELEGIYPVVKRLESIELQNNNLRPKVNTKSAIDITPYDSIRTRGYGVNSSSYMAMIAVYTAAQRGGTLLASAGMGKDGAISVASVKQSAYPTLYAEGNGSYANIEEWWLE